MAKFPQTHQIRTVNWNAPPNVVLESVLNLYHVGQLDAVVRENPRLRQVADGLVTSGYFVRNKRGKLVPRVAADGQWMRPVSAVADSMSRELSPEQPPSDADEPPPGNWRMLPPGVHW